jgi:uncharacterized protein DUF3800
MRRTCLAGSDKYWLSLHELPISLALGLDAMFTAYMDDSGSEGKGLVFVLAGYVAPIKGWEIFSAKWEEALAKPPSLPYFKMREAHRLNDSFFGWTEEDRERRVADLVDVICAQPVMSALALVLTWDDFRRAQAEHPDIVNCHPYDMLFHGAMATTTRLLVEDRSRDPIAFVFDEQGGAGERAILAYRAIRSILPSTQADLVVGSPRMENDKIVPPLQAADLLAWNIRRYVAEQGSFPLLSTGERVPLPDYPRLARLLSHQVIYRRYDYKAIKRVFEAWHRPPAELFPNEVAG